MSARKQRPDEPQTSEGVEPVDLAKAVLSWVAAAIATLIVMLILVFATTRGDLVGLLIAVAIGGSLVGVAVL